MTDRHALLPANATQFETALSEALDFLPVLGPEAEKIRGAKLVDIPDAFVPWLIYEYGLGELLPYLSDPRLALQQGILWQRIRGTPGALKTALGWISLAATLEEGDPATLRWADFQIGLDEAPRNLEFIERLLGVVRISKPARSNLVRVYAVHDFRPLKISGQKIDTAYLDTWSGVTLRDDWPVLSFGRAQGGRVTAGLADIADGHAAAMGSRITRRALRAGFDLVGGDVPIEPATVSAVQSARSITIANGNLGWPDEPWPQGSWGALKRSSVLSRDRTWPAMPWPDAGWSTLENVAIQGGRT